MSSIIILYTNKTINVAFFSLKILFSIINVAVYKSKAYK